MKRRILTLFVDQSIHSLGKTVSPIQIQIKNKTIKNILSNFRLHKTIACDDRDSLCINSQFKNLIEEKNIAKKMSLQNSDIQLFRRFQGFHDLLTVTIEKSKQQFYSRISNKLMDPTTYPKGYRSILGTLLNNKKYLVFHQFIRVIIM